MPDHIGPRLKVYRKRAGMTLRELGARTSLSASYLSKLESGKIGVSVANLDRISHALQIDLTLLVQEEQSTLPWVTRTNRRQRLVIGGDIVYETLTPGNPEFGLAANLVLSVPGDSSGSPVAHGGDEFRYIVKGDFRFQVGDQEYMLHPGDAISHPGSLPHQWENVGSDDGLFVVVGTMPAQR